MSVLIVDDSADALRALKELLRSHGHGEALTASSAEEALRLLGEGAAVEVVLLDVDMPGGMDGVEACRRIKADERLKNVPVLMVTATTDEATLRRSFEAGACDFIAKPIQAGELQARVRSALNLKKEIDECRARERELVRLTEQLRRVNDELQRLAVLDELTGVANRRFFNLLFGQEWGRAAREVLPLSLVMIDVDHFKEYNDHYGHQKGDECLRRVADRLRELLRRSGDHLARYGGDELVMILAHTGAQGAQAVGEQARRAVEGLGLGAAVPAPGGQVTVSVGVATAVPERGTSCELLLAAADRALYEAKGNGRNQVRVFQGLLGQGALPLRGPHAVALGQPGPV